MSKAENDSGIVFADTNLFLRYLTNDIPEQADSFERLLFRARGGEFSFLTNSLVLAEIVWTLERQYRLAKSDIQSKVLAILNTPGVEISDRETILKAIIWYAEKNVDFIDAFNAAWMFENGISTVYTFDRKHFSRFDDFDIVVPGNE
jgi:predicted nucleic-acid-binding protein